MAGSVFTQTSGRFCSLAQRGSISGEAGSVSFSYSPGRISSATQRIIGALAQQYWGFISVFSTCFLTFQSCPLYLFSPVRYHHWHEENPGWSVGGRGFKAAKEEGVGIYFVCLLLPSGSDIHLPSVFAASARGLGPVLLSLVATRVSGAFCKYMNGNGGGVANAFGGAPPPPSPLG